MIRNTILQLAEHADPIAFGIVIVVTTFLSLVLGEIDGSVHTVGGLVMHTLRRVAQVGDKVEVLGLQIEVVDLDRRRVDKVLVEALPPR